MAQRIKQHIASERVEEIAELAEAVADEYCPTGKVAPEEIAVRKGISLIYDHYGDAFDGVIEHEDGQFYIHCNLDRENVLGSPRGRFTVSHELGHYFIDEHRNALASGRVRPHPSFTADRNRSDLRIEREADLFASNLLMPPARFSAALARARKRLGAIQDLAGKFNVSITCAAIRYVDAEVEPSVMIHRAPDGYMWSRLSKQFKAMNCGRIINATAQTPADNPSAICRALGEKPSGVIGAKIAASTWFPALRDGRGFQLREEAMTLGRYGVLTLLTLPDSGFPKNAATTNPRFR
jgi:Zn-dependent peptidase ImmA (M78 family)